MNSSPRFSPLGALLGATALAISLSVSPSALAADGTWTGGGGDGNWPTTGNWLGGTVPGATTGATNQNTALFNNAVNTSVVIDANRNLKTFTFDTGAGAFTFSGGPLIFSTSGSVTLNAGVTNSQAFTNAITAAGTLTLSNNSSTAAASLSAGAITGSATASTTLTLSGTSAASNSVLGVIADGAGGAAGLTKAGTGTWTVSGANTFTGKTAISNGRLSVTSLNSVSGPNHVASSSLGAPITVTAGTIDLGSTSGNAGTLVYTGSGETTDRVINLLRSATVENDGSGALVFSSALTNSAAANANLTFRGTNTGANTMQGGIVDGATTLTNVIKNDAGRWIFAGANTYTGSTNVAAGTLLVNGTHTNAGAYTVSGVLGGNGSISTAGNAGVTINAGGAVDPTGNNLSFTLGTGTFSLAATVAPVASHSLIFDLGTIAASDKVTLVSGTLAIGAGTLEIDDFTLTAMAGFGAGTYPLFTTANALSGSLGTNLTGTLNGYNVTLFADGGTGLSLLVEAVPEPTGTTTLLGCGLVSALGFGWRKWSRSKIA